MNSSGMKRGLAATAISALAVTGLPFLASSASATPITADYPAPDGTVTAADLELLNPDATPTPSEVSTSAYTLMAAGNTDVAQIQFQFSANGTDWTNIGGRVDRINGVFTTSWTPTVDGTVRAVPINAAGDPFEGQAVSQDVQVFLPGNSDTADITGADTIGVWSGDATASNADSEDYTMAVTGTTSLVDTTSPLDNDYRVVVDARTGVTAASTANADVVGTTGTFGAVLPLNGYSFTPGGPDQIVVGAEPQDAVAGVDGARASVEDAAAKSLYLQQLASVTATAEQTNLPPGETTDITVKVVDQNGNPIAGADVFRTVGSTVTNVGTTDADGELVDDNGGSGFTSGNVKYHVNAPAGTVDNPQTTEEPALGDKSSTVAISVYTPALTEVEVFSLYGDVADLDEVDPGTPFTATALDQNGNPMNGEQLYYTWTVDPFDSTQPTLTSEELTAAPTSGTGDDAGQTDLEMADPTDFDPALTSLPSGTWTLKIYRKAVGGNGAFNADPVDYAFGEASVTWSPDDAQAPMGGSTTLKGTLELEDGTALGSIDREGDALDIDRTASLSYLVGTEDNPDTPAALDGGAGDSRIAPLAQQDSTVTSVNTGGTGGAVQFNAAGVANVKVNDANPETQEEFDAELTGDPTGAVSGAGDVDATAVEIDFLESVVADTIAYTSSTTIDANGATPGRPDTLKFTVKNVNGSLLSNKTVNITVTGGGFITDEANAPLTTAQQNGIWANKGATGTVTTDATGVATVVVAIERNEGFDDNFLHTVGVSAEVDGKSASRDTVFTAKEAVNLESIEIVPDEDNTANLPEAQVKYETVEFDVFAHDQFGNLSDEAYDASDDTTRADWNENTGRTQSLDDVPEITAFATLPTDQTISVSALDREGAAADTTAGDAADAIEWYAVDFAASTFTLGQEGPESVPTGTRVTEVLTAMDQKGHPINGLFVEFTRSGPGDEDSDLNDSDTTGPNGEAFYDFVGGTAGTAQVSAVIFADNTPTAERVGAVDDTVSFTGDIDPNPVNAGLNLEGRNNGGKADRLKADAKPAASGAIVVLQKMTKNGWKKVTQGVLNADGNKRFKVADKNGNKRTKYRAIVKANDSVKRGTDTKSVR